MKKWKNPWKKSLWRRRKSSLLIASFMLLFLANAGTGLAQDKVSIRKLKEQKSHKDEVGDLFKIYDDVYYREVIYPLEAYDSIKSLNPETKEYACYFKINGEITYISDVVKSAFYESNWVISKQACIDEKNKTIVISLTFMSGNDSTPTPIYFLIDLNTKSFSKITFSNAHGVFFGF